MNFNVFHCSPTSKRLPCFKGRAVLVVRPLYFILCIRQSYVHPVLFATQFLVTFPVLLFPCHPNLPVVFPYLLLLLWSSDLQKKHENGTQLAILLQCYCRVIALPWPYHCHAKAMSLPSLPCHCHVIAMPKPWCQMAYWSFFCQASHVAGNWKSHRCAVRAVPLQRSPKSWPRQRWWTHSQFACQRRPGGFLKHVCRMKATYVRCIGTIWYII